MRDTTDRRGDERVLEATRRLIALLRPAADAHFSVRLWDGSLEPLGHDVRPGLELQINSPGVLPSLVRWPSFDRVVRHFAHGRIDISGGTLLDLVGPHSLDDEAFQRIRAIPKRELLGHLLPFFTASGEHPDESRAFHGNITGHGRHKADNKAFIQFHYDVGNDFYRLFLDPEMQYSCGYFESWDESLETAQRAKLDHICRKLRLEPGDRLLDIGCGWGGLLCYAAQTYGVSGHGVTLSKQQLAFAQDKVRRLGLDDRVTLELRDYQDLTGTFDKIVSVGMYEYIGLANIPTYFRTVHRLLKPGGLFLNHAISRKAVWSRRWTRPSVQMRVLQRYIFPGGELDDIGRTVIDMEKTGFEIHDVEGLREHYQRTCKLWCERLFECRGEAEHLVGGQTTRIWLGFLAACSLTFQRGSARLYQTLASKAASGRPAWGPAPVPPTRRDLYT